MLLALAVVHIDEPSISVNEQSVSVDEPPVSVQELFYPYVFVR